MGYCPAFVLAKLRSRACGYLWQHEGTNRAEESKHQSESLISWFKENAKWTNSKRTSPNRQFSGDHHFYLDRNGAAIFMETLPGCFGKIADPDFNPQSRSKYKTTESITHVDATPEEYLERMVFINQEFKAGWMVMGVTEKGGKLIIKTTLPHATTNTQKEIEPWLKDQGWSPVEPLKRAFYSSAKDLLIVQIQPSQKKTAITVNPVTEFLISRPCASLKRHFGLVSEDLVGPTKCPFETGAVDQTLVSDFLNLLVQRNIHELRQTPPDPALGIAAVIDANLRLNREVDNVLINKAISLVNCMNKKTVKDLVHRLHIEVPENWSNFNPATLDDPLIANLLHMLKDDASITENRVSQRKEHYIQNLLTKAFDEIESGKDVKVSRPTPPCTIGEALRYLTDNPTESALVLEAAFRAFLAVEPTSEEKELEEKELNRLQVKISEISNRSPLGISPARNTVKTKESSEAELKNILEIRKSRDSFQPETNLHSDLERKAEISWFRFSRSLLPVDNVAMLELLTGGFRAFWNAHHAAFKRLSHSAQKKQTGLRSTRQDIGKNGATAREHVSWIKLTKDFCAYVKVQAGHVAVGEMLKWLKDFVDTLHLDKRTQKKKRDFLGTLVTFTMKGTEDRAFGEVLETLRRVDIKALNEKTIEECSKVIDGTQNNLRMKK